MLDYNCYSLTRFYTLFHLDISNMMKSSIWATFLHYLYRLRIYFANMTYNILYRSKKLNIIVSTKSSIEDLQIPKAWMPHILHREVSIFNYFIFCFNDDIDLSNKATFIFRHIIIAYTYIFQ